MNTISNLKETSITGIKGSPVRKCLNCDHVLKGRPDKKFCGDYCRNAYNNPAIKARKKRKNKIKNIAFITMSVLLILDYVKRRIMP
jgi:hypothetical protein